MYLFFRYITLSITKIQSNVINIYITKNNKLDLPLEKAEINELRLPFENSKNKATVLSIKKHAIKKICNSMIILLRALSME